MRNVSPARRIGGPLTKLIAFAAVTLVVTGLLAQSLGMHITLEVTKDNGPYVAGQDAPVYGAHNGPSCRGLPDPPNPAPQVPLNDGYDYGTARPVAPLPVGVPGLTAPMGYAGTAEEQALIRPLVGMASGVSPDAVPDSADLLWGPLLRGTVVNVG